MSTHAQSRQADQKPTTTMRLREIRVEGLFGTFNHIIPLQPDDRITIIHGPNGYGKTIILKILADLFGYTRSTRTIRGTIFDRFSVTFHDGRKLELTQNRLPELVKKDMHPRQSWHKVEVRLLDTKQREQEKPLVLVGDEDDGRRLHEIERRFPVIRLDEGLWRDLRTDEELEYDDIIERWGDLVDRPRPKTPRWLAEIRDQFNVRLIETQRLGRQELSPRGRSRALTVQRFSADLAKEIKTALGEYAATAQELDRTFPARLIQQAKPLFAVEELRSKLVSLEAQRARLTKLGFLDREQSLIAESQEAAQSKPDVLSIYVQDIERKFGVFDDLARRVDLLQGLLSERFKYKSLSIDRERGLVFASRTGDTISPHDLSSGEQHEIVLLYELLFRTRPNSMILIDEPEISLHITWQEQFLPDLQRLAETSQFYALIATHSPEIIGRQWRLTVRLRGPDDPVIQGDSPSHDPHMGDQSVS